jgi:hypothetical protein
MVKAGGVKHRGARHHPADLRLHLDLSESAAAKADDQPFDPAIANDHIGSHTEHRDRDFGGERGQHPGQVVLVGG